MNRSLLPFQFPSLRPLPEQGIAEVQLDNHSFLDVVCLVAAIPVTIIYKAAAQKAPFSAVDPFTKGLLGASNWSEILDEPR